MKRAWRIFLLALGFCVLFAGVAAAGPVTWDENHYYFTDLMGDWKAAIYRVDAEGGNKERLLATSNYSMRSLQYYEGRVYYITMEESMRSMPFYLCYTPVDAPKHTLYRKNVEEFLIVGDMLYYTQPLNDRERVALYAQDLTTGKKQTIHNKPDVYVQNLREMAGCLVYDGKGETRIYDHAANKNRVLLPEGYVDLCEYDGYVYARQEEGLFRYTYDAKGWTLDDAVELPFLAYGQLIAVANGRLYAAASEDDPYDDEVFYNVLYRQPLDGADSEEIYRYEGAPSDYQYFQYCGEYIWVYWGGGDMSTGYVTKLKI